MKDYLLIIVVGFALQLVLTSLLKKIALKFNFVDNPNARKLHKKSIPLLGGAGIILTAAILWSIFYQAATDLNMKGVAFGGALIALVGLYDDKFEMKWSIKFLLQFAIVGSVILIFGIRTTIMDNIVLDSLLTLVWVVGLTNSLNLLDNMDGLSAGTASIACFFFSLLALKEGQPDLSIYCFSLSIATLAFLNFNFPPASIFMGDMGSMFLGMNLGFVGVLLQVTSFENWQIAQSVFFRNYNILTVAVPLLVLAIPLFDTFFVMALRLLNGIKISTPGKDHSSHRIMHIKSSSQRFIDKVIIGYIKLSKRNDKLKKEGISPNVAISQTRSVLTLYFFEILFGIAALLVTNLSVFGAAILLLFLCWVIWSAAQRLAAMQVYS